MPNKVWKCDYCSNTSISRFEIVEHEAVCFLNPKLKRCLSCRHSGFHYDIEECQKGMSFNHMLNIAEEHIFCDYWEE